MSKKFIGRYIKPLQKARRLQTRKTPLPWRPRFLEVNKEPSIPYPIRETLQPKKIDLSNYLNMKEGDLVQVLYGRDQGKQGLVLQINRKRNRVYVEGCNMKDSFWNPRKGPGEPSIITVEMPIHITNLALLDPVTKKPTRVKRRYMMNGECIRISKHSGCAMPEPVSKPFLKPAVDYRAIRQSIPKNELAPIKDIYLQRDTRHFRMLERVARYMMFSDPSATPVPYAS